MAGYLLPPYGPPCDLWVGPPSKHQSEARDVIGLIPAFTWIVPACPNKMCLTREHLAVRRPHHLAYPAETCIYCGEIASHMDHLIPEPWTGPTLRHHVLTVPSCRECNCLLGDTLTSSITERRAVAHTRLRRRNRKWLAVQPRTEKELREYGRTLRTSIRGGMRIRAEVERRLAWPEDPFYDIQALERSGIADPYLCGLLSEPNAEAS